MILFVVRPNKHEIVCKSLVNALTVNSPITKRLMDALQKTLPMDSLDNLTTLVAVSGGPDSVALADFLVKQTGARARICLAHFNHQLREEESDEDEAFVRQFADSLDCELIVQKASDDPEFRSGEIEPWKRSHRGEGLESLARQARYRFLKNAASVTGARFVATAHTFDDQVETIIQRLFRGTGIQGLTGIHPVRELMPGVSLIRPFLTCRKSDLMEYLDDWKLDYRLDGSNATNQFTRNRIRNELIPLVAEIFNNEPASAVHSLSEQVSDFVDWMDAAKIDPLFQNLVSLNSTTARIRIDQVFWELPAIIINQLWIKIWTKMEWPRQQMTREKWNSITSLALEESNPAKISLPGNLLAERQTDYLTIWDASKNQK